MIQFLVSSLRKEIQERLVFRWSLIFELISTSTLLVSFFLIDRFHARIFGDRLTEVLTHLHTSYFGYVSLGLAVAALANVGLGGVLTHMSSERATRSFEYLMASPISIHRWAVVAGLSNLVQAFSRLVLIYGMAVFVLGLKVPRFDLAAVLLVVLVSFIPLWSLSVLTTSLSLVSRRGDPLGFMIGMSFEVLGGVYAPIEVLPKWLAHLGELLPITPSVRAMQAIVYRGAGIHETAHELAQLGVLALVYLPISLIILGLADRICRRKGYYCLS